MFCCKNIMHEITAEPDSEVFGLFLNSMKGLKIKDVFLYVLHKAYMDIGPKKSVFKKTIRLTAGT